MLYGGGNSNALLDETGSVGAVDVGDAPSGSSIQRADLAGTWEINPNPGPGTLAFTAQAANLMISEVFYDAPGPDSSLEWVELFNPGPAPVNLSGWSLGWGGADYTYGQLQLSGTIGAGETFLVGGPVSTSTNSNPVLDLAVAFAPELQNSGTPADGIALYNLPVTSVTASTIPVDVVIYGGDNTNELVDETGAVGITDVGDASPGQSIERTDAAGTWQIQPAPSPGTTPITPGALHISLRINSADPVTGQVQIELALSVAATVAIESSETLQPGSWRHETTTTLEAGTHSVPVTVIPGPEKLFFRAVEAVP